MAIEAGLDLLFLKMKVRLSIVKSLLCLLCLAFGFTAQAQHYVPLGGVVDSTLVLPKMGADSVYLVNESLNVVDGGQLKVEAGVKLFFGQSAYLRVDGGSLSMNGQPNDSIYLLCYEFSHDWAGVQLKNVAESDTISLSYVRIMGALTAVNASNCLGMKMSHVTFNNYYAGKGVELSDCSGCTIDSCFFNQCISGIELKARTGDCEFNRIAHCIFDQGQINIEMSNVGYGFKCNKNTITDNCFQGAATAISFESVGGLSDKDAKNFILNNVISSKLPDGSGTYSSYGIKAAMDSLVIRNNIFWKNDEAVRMLRVCDLVFEGNSFYDNGMVLTNLLSSGSACFVNNTISEAEKRIVTFQSDKSRMNGNNFLHYKKDALLFANLGSEDVDMRANYWDTEEEEVIDGVIFDKNDNPTLGEIVYDGYLPVCDTTAPISPPFMVKQQYVNGSYRISWEENPEQDVDHYVLFYGDFDYYRFANHTNPIYGTSYVLSSQQAENVAVIACDHGYNPDIYASKGQSAYAFAVAYPYAGEDGELCASQAGYSLNKSTIPYTYNRFVWKTSGSGHFSDSLTLRPIYYPSEGDYDNGSVTLTLEVLGNGIVRTDQLQLQLFQEATVYAGTDYYSGFDRPIMLNEAETYHSDSICWRTVGDGVFEDDHALHTMYFPGPNEKVEGFVRLYLEAWSYCGYACDSIQFDLLKEYSLEGTTWLQGSKRPNSYVIAAGLDDDNTFFSGFYRTVSDEEGHFRFSSLLPDTYILYAFADTLDPTAGGAYYLGDFQWNESNLIDVDGFVYDVDIELPALRQGFDQGQGVIAGVFDYPETQFRAKDFYCASWFGEGDGQEFCSEGLSNVSVLLMDVAKQRMLGFVLTDAHGEFRFRNLPFGTYVIMADLPRYGHGLCEQIEITPEHPFVDGLHLYIDNQKRVVMRHEGDQPQIASTRLYPNPVKDCLTIDGLKALKPYAVSVVDVAGAVVMPSTLLHTDMLGQCVISVNHLQSGMYFITINGSTGSKNLKFVKY